MGPLTRYLFWAVFSMLYATVLHADDARWKKIPSGTEGFYYDPGSVVVKNGIGKIWSKIEIQGKVPQLDLWEIDCAKRLSRRARMIVESNPAQTVNWNESWIEIAPETLAHDFFTVVCKKDREQKNRRSSKNR